MKKLVTLSIATIVAISMVACGSTNTPAPAAATPAPATPAPATPAPAEATPAESAAPESEGAYKDGTYSAELPDFDEKSGWKDNIEIVVTGGEITGVNWNSTHKDGGDDKKTASHGPGYDMKVAGAKKDWYEQAELMEQELIRLQDPALIPVDGSGKTDAVAGVSITIDGFVSMAEEALAAAK